MEPSNLKMLQNGGMKNGVNVTSLKKSRENGERRRKKKSKLYKKQIL